MLLAAAFLWLLASCQTTNETNKYPNPKEEKQKGAHVFGIDSTTTYEFLHRDNIEWVTVVPWGFQEDYNSAHVRHHRGDSNDSLRRNQLYLKRIKRLHDAGFKVFVKPHVWINDPSDGKWRADIMPSDEEGWELWKKTYRDFIFRYLQVAIAAEAEMFCIGTEFTRLVIEHSEYWRTLIKDIRAVYPGKITYAANWYEEYESITFWNELDYIGVQAYFPLVKKEAPSTSELSKGWTKHKSVLKSISEKYNRQILFTELGYKSCTDSGVRPWEWIEDPNGAEKIYCAATQENCYQSFFNSVWLEQWFAGVHLWQWHTSYVGRPEVEENIDFTPQGKPAEIVIRKAFTQEN